MAAAPEQIKRFMNKLTETEACWEWNAYIQSNGYGQHSFGRRTVLAHRASYELFKGKIGKGMEIDHTCNNKKCVNPNHLEEVTTSENQARSYARGRKLSGAVDFQKAKTHCPSGHPYDQKNTRINPTRYYRICRECKRIQSAACKARRRIA